MEKTLVSIIVPTYNCEKYISRTISSILSQTYTNFEIIVVDDNSSDSTIDIISSFNDRRIIITRNDKNYGAAFCRNKGIQVSRGSFIAFLDGDDYWLQNKLMAQLSFMVDNEIGFSYTNYYVYDDRKEIINQVISGPKIINKRKMFQTNYIGCCTAMYQKSINPHLQIPIDIYKRNDYALWLKLSENSNCYLLDIPLAVYNKHTNSISSINKTKLFGYHLVLFKKVYGYGRLKSFFYATRNFIFYVFKRIFYKKTVHLNLEDIFKH